MSILDPGISTGHPDAGRIYAEALERAKDLIARQAAMIEHLRGGPTPLYTAVDMANAARDGFRDGAASKEKIIDALLNHCEDGECHVCSQIICPHANLMHFHHDGCPSCAQDEPE